MISAMISHVCQTCSPSRRTHGCDVHHGGDCEPGCPRYGLIRMRVYLPQRLERLGTIVDRGSYVMVFARTAEEALHAARRELGLPETSTVGSVVCLGEGWNKIWRRFRALFLVGEFDRYAVEYDDAA